MPVFPFPALSIHTHTYNGITSIPSVPICNSVMQNFWRSSSVPAGQDRCPCTNALPSCCASSIVQTVTGRAQMEAMGSH
ncbi:hypothetical protein XELAEV_18044560mg [Xenopus laevis]|uniref:Uncharacterized protein n=1 Tax=Xenopus laevis TaxID=8355 RepID=A0A974BZ88_XENLA|nr:hypothetical protein XELAEV_18044560mg [Xenopus laevis]